jgi:hypothetical protein
MARSTAWRQAALLPAIDQTTFGSQVQSEEILSRRHTLHAFKHASLRRRVDDGHHRYKSKKTVLRFEDSSSFPTYFKEVRQQRICKHGCLRNRAMASSSPAEPQEPAGKDSINEMVRALEGDSDTATQAATDLIARLNDGGRNAILSALFQTGLQLPPPLFYEPCPASGTQFQT